MKNFTCQCGARVFFQNTHCLNCHAALGFDAASQTLHALTPVAGSYEKLALKNGKADIPVFKYCANYYSYNACNWLLPYDSEEPFCESCRLNQTVPDLNRPANVTRWIKLETAKRHLLYSLLSLGLPIINKPGQKPQLAFAFLEDARTNDNYAESFIATGHSSGLITINLAEADDSYREQVREQLGEYYRTILGHFRHEIGHYYYELLVVGSHWQDDFASYFGDPTVDYQQAMNRYYEQGGNQRWEENYISQYAQTHPLEDWAETWAHYLHITDTLDTAWAFDIIEPLDIKASSMDDIVSAWLALSVRLNALNRSMGLHDAYPFVITPAISDKLNLVHQVVVSAS